MKHFPLPEYYTMFFRSCNVYLKDFAWFAFVIDEFNAFKASNLYAFMFGFYTLIILFQVFCLYHAYQRNAEQKWYWFIVLFSVIGCLMYLFHAFNDPGNVEAVKEGVKSVVNNNYKIEQLEKAVQHNDSFTNKINLADCYVTYGRYADAIELYLDCLKGFMSDDLALRMKLLQTYFLHQDYPAAIALGMELETEKVFKNAAERLAYAWSLHYDGKTELAETIFQDMDKSFSNYEHRTEYCKFLIATDKKEALKNKLNDLLDEFEKMKSHERTLHRNIIREIKDISAAQITT